MYLTIYITLTVISILGNSMILYVFSKPEFLKKPTFRYLSVATIFDTINIFLIWPFNYREFFLIDTSHTSCMVYHFISFLTHIFCSWINILNSIDTCCAVKYYSKFQFRNKLNFQIIVLLVFFILSALCSLPYVLYIHFTQPVCGIMDRLINNYFQYYYVVLYIVVPFIFMVTFNSITFLELIKQKKRVKINNFTDAKNLFKVSVGLNLFFLITQLPFQIMFTVTTFQYSLDMIFYDFMIFAKLLLQVFYSCDIIIYFIANKLFRKHCLSLFSSFNSNFFTSILGSSTRKSDIKLQN